VHELGWFCSVHRFAALRAGCTSAACLAGELSGLWRVLVVQRFILVQLCRVAAGCELDRRHQRVYVSSSRRCLGLPCDFLGSRLGRRLGRLGQLVVLVALGRSFSAVAWDRSLVSAVLRCLVGYACEGTGGERCHLGLRASA
jgi:hypothetical protein